MSNRLEDHLDRLESLLSTDSPSSPLTPETMVVQSQGMQKWLSLRLAEHLGVWSNCRYLFPNAFINEMYDKLTDTITNGERFFDREAMVWAIMQNLPKLAVDREFSSSGSYPRASHTLLTNTSHIGPNSLASGIMAKIHTGKLNYGEEYQQMLPARTEPDGTGIFSLR